MSIIDSVIFFFGVVFSYNPKFTKFYLGTTQENIFVNETMKIYLPYHIYDIFLGSLVSKRRYTYLVYGIEIQKLLKKKKFKCHVTQAYSIKIVNLCKDDFYKFCDTKH